MHVLPRYVLHNTLDVALQYKQQGAGGERELPPAAPRAVQWPNATLPLRLCLRVQARRRLPNGCKAARSALELPEFSIQACITSTAPGVSCPVVPLLLLPVPVSSQLLNNMLGMQSSTSCVMPTLCIACANQEAGWLWSGGVALNTPGDQFVKIRHRYV